MLEYAEAMTSTPTTVSDELSASLLARLGPAALVELTVFIGFANMAGRVNTAPACVAGLLRCLRGPLAAVPEVRGGVGGLTEGGCRDH